MRLLTDEELTLVGGAGNFATDLTNYATGATGMATPDADPGAFATYYLGALAVMALDGDFGTGVTTPSAKVAADVLTVMGYTASSTSDTVDNSTVNSEIHSAAVDNSAAGGDGGGKTGNYDVGSGPLHGDGDGGDGDGDGGDGDGGDGDGGDGGDGDGGDGCF